MTAGKLYKNQYAYLVRTDSANTFMQDVADRVKNYVQLNTDGHYTYLQAVGEAFGDNIDFAQLVKLYGSEKEATGTEMKYSLANFNGAKKTVISGNPGNEGKAD